MLINDTYEILDEIGKGGMSVIYRARHVRLNTIFAIKQIRKNQDANLDFSAEANLLKRLSHPMLVRISDIFEDAENLYIVEDFVDGEDLHKVLKRQGCIPEKTLVEWFKDLCGVLEYLHEQKPRPVIFRDMKPSNIMLQKDGTLKLIDFGIAREYKAESRMDTTLVGTYGYAAPEQFNTQMQSDARTDIYSLGMTMHHLATGKSPLDPPYTAVLVRKLRPELSAGLEHIIAKCIQQEPQDRYQNVKELLHDLENIHTFDREYENYKRNKMLRKLIIFLLAASGIFCIVYGNSLKKPAETEPEVSETVDENEARYYELIDEAKSMQLDAADYRFYEAKQMFPDRPDAYAAEIQYYYDSQIPYTYENVTMIFEELGDNKIQLLTDFPKAGVITGKSYFMQGNYVEAASVLYTMLSVIDEPEPEIYLDYAIACCRMGDIERAQNTVQEYGKELPEDYALFIQAEVDRAQLKYKDAEAEYLEVIRLNQNTYNILEEAYLSLGEMYREYFQNALQTGEDQRIEDSMRKCVAMCLEAEKNANISYSIRLGQIRDFALYESKEFSYDEIGNAWKELIDNGLEEPRYYGNAIIAYRRAEQYDKASEIKDLYDQKYPNDPLDIH